MNGKLKTLLIDAAILFALSYCTVMLCSCSTEYALELQGEAMWLVECNGQQYQGKGASEWRLGEGGCALVRYMSTWQPPDTAWTNAWDPVGDSLTVVIDTIFVYPRTPPLELLLVERGTGGYSYREVLAQAVLDSTWQQATLCVPQEDR